jgi:hypothetical protein
VRRVDPRRIGVALVAIAGLAFAAPAGALGAAPTLSGETFLDFPAGDGAVSPTPRIEGTCDPDGVTTFTIRGEGIAAGPYPGTFTETVTARIGPQDQAAVPNQGNFQGSFGFQVGPLLSFDARFQIDAVDPTTNEPVTVTGRKELTTDRPPFDASQFGVTDPGNNGFCATLSGETPPPGGPFTPNTPPLTGFWRAVDASTLEYEAVIRTATGVVRDEGAARASARNVYAEFSAVPGSNAGRVDQFVEIFNSDGAEAVPLTRAACNKDSEIDLGSIFRNQGDCVSFVATDGRNEPGRNVPGAP